MRIIIFNILFVFVFTINAQTNNIINSHLRGITVYDVTGDDDYIWAATNGNGIYQYDKKKNKWSNYSTDDGSLSLNFFYTIDATDRFVFAGSTDGLFIFDKSRNRWTKRKFSKGGQLGNWIRSVKYDPYEDVVWIGRFMYLTKYDIRARRFSDYDLTVGKDEKTNTIKTIAIDGDSLVWFGTENGLHKYDKSRDIDDEGTIMFYDNRLNYFRGEGETVSISALLLEQNVVWIGLDEFITVANPEFNIGGIYRFDRRNEWLRFDNNQGLRANGVADLELAGNYIWVALYQFGANTKEVYGRGVALINRNTLEVTTLINDELPETVFSFYFDGSKMWMGADDGLYEVDLSNEFITNMKIRKK